MTYVTLHSLRARVRRVLHTCEFVRSAPFTSHCLLLLLHSCGMCKNLRARAIGREFCKIKTSSKNVQPANGARADCPENFRVRRGRRLEAPGPLTKPCNVPLIQPPSPKRGCPLWLTPINRISDDHLTVAPNFSANLSDMCEEAPR